MTESLCFMFNVYKQLLLNECLVITSILVFSEVKDPIPLHHFGKREILEKIDLMEDQLDVPMIFDEDQVPPVPFVTGQDISAWDEGIAVHGAARGHRREHQTLLLMADMFGFASEEEMEDTKAYLWSHGWYQLEQVVNECQSLVGFQLWS